MFFRSFKPCLTFKNLFTLLIQIKVIDSKNKYQNCNFERSY